MASAADFKAWAQQDLVIPLGDRTFTVRPPSVDDAGKLLACAVRGEVVLGIVKGPIPDEVQEVLDSIEPGEHPALGDTYQEMVDAKLSPVTIDRFAYYAIFYWARGEEYADRLARILFTPRDIAGDASAEGGGDRPKD
ncbi:hypothetical protein ACI3KS_05110 [Microbacterium sp. ZW T5_45]|uniref:DUF7426 family protein n=1 Tax=Microbacterium sp. ZW T5_45 TaxID=3378080 RepID=UPI0038543333